MRSLLWHPNLGKMKVKLSFENGDFEFLCFPIQGILIHYFDEKSKRIISFDLWSSIQCLPFKRTQPSPVYHKTEVGLLAATQSAERIQTFLPEPELRGK